MSHGGAGDDRDQFRSLLRRGSRRRLGERCGVIAVVELASFAVAALLLRLRRPGLSVVLTVLTPPQAPIRSLSYQHRTSQR